MTGGVIAQCGAGLYPPQPTTAGAGAIEAPSAGGSFDVAYPSGIAAGDMLLLQVYVADATAAAALSAPSGWALVGSVLSVDGTTRLAVFSTIASGSESGSLTYALTSANADVFSAGRMYCVPGGVNTEAVGTGASDASSTTMASVAVTTTQFGELVVGFFAARVNTTIGNIGSTYVESFAEYANAAGVILSMQHHLAPAPEAVGIDTGTLGAAGTHRMRVCFGITRH